MTNLVDHGNLKKPPLSFALTHKVNSHRAFKHWSQNKGGMQAEVRNVKCNTSEMEC